jgi:hypothetical protein
VVAVSREFRWLARELRPGPVRRPSVVAMVLGWVLRYFPEIAAVLGGVWLWAVLANLLGGWPAAVALAAVAGLLLWWTPSRWVLVAVAGCVVTRHRLRTGLVELRLTSRAGRLPLLVWLAPSPVGERVWLWCRAGISAEDIADETERVRSTCFARDVRVTRDRRWSALVRLDVIRRDPLASDRIVRSPLSDVAGGADA